MSHLLLGYGLDPVRVLVSELCGVLVLNAGVGEAVTHPDPLELKAEWRLAQALGVKVAPSDGGGVVPPEALCEDEQLAIVAATSKRGGGDFRSSDVGYGRR